jgi:hypothetical protein
MVLGRAQADAPRKAREPQRALGRRPLRPPPRVAQEGTQLARPPVRPLVREPSRERACLGQRRGRVGTFGKEPRLAGVEMALRCLVAAERLFKLCAERRKLKLGLSRLRQRRCRRE